MIIRMYQQHQKNLILVSKMGHSVQHGVTMIKGKLFISALHNNVYTCVCHEASLTALIVCMFLQITILLVLRFKILTFLNLL